MRTAEWIPSQPSRRDAVSLVPSEKLHCNGVPAIIDGSDLFVVVDRDLVFLRAGPQALDQIYSIDAKISETGLLLGFGGYIDFAQNTARCGVQDGLGDVDAAWEDHVPEVESV